MKLRYGALICRWGQGLGDATLRPPQGQLPNAHPWSQRDAGVPRRASQSTRVISTWSIAFLLSPDETVKLQIRSMIIDENMTENTCLQMVTADAVLNTSAED